VHNKRRPCCGPLHHRRVQHISQDRLHACHRDGAADKGSHVHPCLKQGLDHTTAYEAGNPRQQYNLVCKLHTLPFPSWMVLTPNATGEQRPTHEDMEWGGKRVGWGVRSSGLFGKE
jgi:hypothetical protein